MRKDHKLINILNPINNFNTYSKYSESLEKIFKKKSLKNLLYNLNNPTVFNESDDEKLCKREIERYTTERDRDKDKDKDKFTSNDQNYHHSLLDYNHDDYLKSQKDKFEKNKKTEPWSINKKTPRIPLIHQNVDFFKYNPNYNSIYKNVPSFTFVNSSRKKLKGIDRINKHNSEKHCSKNNDLFSRNKNDMETIENYFDNNIHHPHKNNKRSHRIKNKIKYFPLLTSVSSRSSNSINKSNNNLNNLYDKNNHTFRFSRYSSRKPVELKVNNKVTYLKDFDYLMHLNKTIDFRKMAKRNEKNLINTYTLKNPSMCYYNPKFDCIEIKTKKISFNPESFKDSIKFKKSQKLKKILMSYQVTTEYNTIDNSKLVKAESITKLLNL